MAKPVIETLHGLSVSDTTVTIAVTSTGCTDRSDFTLDVKESDPPRVTFSRIRPDVCRMRSHTVDIAFSLKEIGACTFTVANPFEPGPPRLGPGPGPGPGPGHEHPTHTWSAVADVQPPAPFSLGVTGKVEVPTPGHKAELTPAAPQGINPAQLILELTVRRLPGVWPQVVSEIDASYVDENDGGGLKTVAIRYRSGIVAVVDVEEVH